MSTVPGLTCARCGEALAGALCRRTDDGFVHVARCWTPAALTGGVWALVGHVRRWVRAA